jgi:hypothetical protein
LCRSWDQTLLKNLKTISVFRMANNGMEILLTAPMIRKILHIVNRKEGHVFFLSLELDPLPSRQLIKRENYLPSLSLSLSSLCVTG